MLVFHLVLAVLVYSFNVAVAANFTRLDVPGATCTSASKLNNRGQIVGWYCKEDGGIQSFLWQKGKFVTLAAVPGSVNSAAGINNHGEIVGSYIDGDGRAHGYLLEKNIFHSIEFPGATETAATDISDDRQIVGSYVDASGNLRGFLLAQGRFTSIEIPDASFNRVLGTGNWGRLVGFYVDDEQRAHGFLWERGLISTIDHPDASFSTALHDLNSLDDIVGTDDGEDAFAFRRNRFHALEFPSFVLDPRVTGINDKRQIVGEYSDETGKFYGFLWLRPAFGSPIPNQLKIAEKFKSENSAREKTEPTVSIRRPWFLEIP